MDVVWLKKDVRLHDHGPLATAFASGRPVCILYVYEPDQLAHHSVHGSHVAFCNEGLRDLSARLAALCQPPPSDGGTGPLASARPAAGPGAEVSEPEPGAQSLPCVTCRHGEITQVLAALHSCAVVAPDGTAGQGIARLLAHEETGHGASYDRDRRVRRFCRAQGIQVWEKTQTGVSRGLKDRNRFSANFKAFLRAPQYKTPEAARVRRKLVCGLPSCGLLAPASLADIDQAHRGDRRERQAGGETQALRAMATFLSTRARGYSAGISSPLTSWTAGSRLSPYLTAGQLSLRKVLQTLAARQRRCRELARSGADPEAAGWAKSLSACVSRLSWRSHFMQKLESEPELEHHAMCRSYDGLRTEEGEWNEAHYAAWRDGRTGFPMVDACMRCLDAHGWLNFRMRAMVVSFACWNLWLDWRRIGPHLARVFLDYEPGIHYPQLQMQSGVTGINAMRVYSVTKQAREQDPQGVFIRRHVPELRDVPREHIHEPWKMTKSAQARFNVQIGGDREAACAEGTPWYPRPIVDEQASAREAKRKVHAVRQRDATKAEASRVYRRHGSRMRRGGSSRPQASGGRVPGNVAAPGRPPNPAGAPTRAAAPSSAARRDAEPSPRTGLIQPTLRQLAANGGKRRPALGPGESPPSKQAGSDRVGSGDWPCAACTFLNSNPRGLACAVCATPRANCGPCSPERDDGGPAVVA